VIPISFLEEEEIIEKLKSFQLLRRSLNSSLLDFIDQAQSYNYIPEVTRIAEDLGIHASTVWKFMNSLSKKGLSFRGIPNISGMGAVEVSIILDKYIPYNETCKILLREYAPILPKGTYLKYIVPRDKLDQYVDFIKSKLPYEPAKTLITNYTVIGKPNMRRYYDISQRTIKIDWKELYSMIISLPKESIPKDVVRTKKLDIIDLYILRRLEISPFDSLRKVTDYLNKELSPVNPINYIRVLRHFKNHVEGKDLIKGVRLDVMPLYPIDSVQVKIILEGHPTELLRVVKVLTSHPFFPEGTLSSESSALIKGFLPIDFLLSASMFLDELKKEGIAKSWSIIMLDFSEYRKLALPIQDYLTPPESLDELKEDQLLTEVIERKPQPSLAKE
jgi:hypothetical protein